MKTIRLDATKIPRWILLCEADEHRREEKTKKKKLKHGTDAQLEKKLKFPENKRKIKPLRDLASENSVYADVHRCFKEL